MADMNIAASSSDGTPERDVVGGAMHQRLFGSSDVRTPLDLPGAGGKEEFREIFENETSKSAGAQHPPASLLSPSEQRMVSALFEKFIKWTRNTNFTASEPAHAQPMLWSDPIDLSANYVLPAAVGPYASVLSFIVPSGRYARINGYGVQVGGGFTYDGSILWRITVNGLAVPSLLDWGEQRGTIAIPRQTFIVVPQDQKISFDVRRAVAAGGTSDVTMALKGWTWRLRKNFEGTKSSVTAF